MKVQSKILLSAIVPLLALGAITVLLSHSRINSVVSGAIQTGLRSTAISVRDTLIYVDDGEYDLDKNGNLCKGDFNITQNADIINNIKENTGVDITVFFGEIRYLTSIVDNSGQYAVNSKASDKVIEEVLKNGNDYFSGNIDMFGSLYFGYYVPLYSSNGQEIVGMIFAGIPQADAESQINSILLLLITIIIGISLLATLVIIIIVRMLVKALKKDCEALEQVARGRLDIEVDPKILKRKDEIGDISRSVQKLKEQLTTIIGNIINHSKELHTSSRYMSSKSGETAIAVSQVEKAVEDIAAGASTQADDTQKATDSVIHMGDMVEDTAREAEEIRTRAMKMSTLGNEAYQTLHELRQINDNARESIDIIYKQTNMTNESVQKIKEATGLITSIAEETNLLSLNASIEAARAGEQGRGFAVVAAQIQKLAEQSNESAKKIDEIISYLIEDSGKAVETMNDVQRIMNLQNENVELTDDRFSKVLQGIKESIDSIEKIVVKTADMDKARSAVIDTVQSLSSIAEENAASTQETSASVTQITAVISDITKKAEELLSIANEMEEGISVFKL